MAKLKTSYLVLRTPDGRAFVTKLHRGDDAEKWAVTEGSGLAEMGYELVREFKSRNAAHAYIDRNVEVA